MAVFDLSQLDPETKGRKELKGAKRIRSYSTFYRILAEFEDNEADVLLSSLVPALGEFHPTDPRAFVKSFDIQREPDDADFGERVAIWKGQADWTTDKDAYGGSPLYPDTPAEISYTFDRREIIVQKDRDDEPVVNTADDPYDPPLKVDFPIPVKTIKVNLADADFDIGWLEQYQFAINEDTYDGWDTEKVLVQDLQATRKFYVDEDDTEIVYWEVTVKLAFNVFKWQPELMSQGYNEIKDGVKRPILIDGQEVKQPLPLDEDGEALIGAAVSDAYFKKYNVYYKRTFSVFAFS